MQTFLECLKYYASTFVKNIKENYAIKKICRRLQAM